PSIPFVCAVRRDHLIVPSFPTRRSSDLGTTWLEELIGLAEAGGSGLDLAKEIYAEAYGHREELCGPYATVIDIDPDKLASPDEVDRKSTRLNSSHQIISYAVFGLKKKKE